MGVTVARLPAESALEPMLMSQKFLIHHPFAVLVDLGWVCESLGPG